MSLPGKMRDRATLPNPHMNAISDDIGEYIARDVWLVRDLVW